MKYLTVLLLSAALGATPAFANGDTLSLGDKGYKHHEMHPHYQKIFNSGRCHCNTGECRPTKYRYKDGDVTKVQMVLNGKWIDIPPSALIDKDSVPPELLEYQAHICAFRDERRQLTVECAMVTKGTS